MPGINFCVIIDLEGFFVRKTFLFRELGYVTYEGHRGRYAFTPLYDYTTLDIKSRKTVKFVRQKIHGLTYYPESEEHSQPIAHLPGIVRTLYNDYKTNQRDKMGFKGGHVERNLLESLQIPWVDLEHCGCPKFDKLKTRIPHELLLPSCSFHKDPSNHHCPITECSAFWRWINDCI